MQFSVVQWLEVCPTWFQHSASAFRATALLDAEPDSGEFELFHDEANVGVQELSDVVDGGAPAPRGGRRGLLTRLLEVRA